MRIDNDAPAKKVFDARVGGKRRRNRPCLRWTNQVEETLTKFGVRGCR